MTLSAILARVDRHPLPPPPPPRPLEDYIPPKRTDATVMFISELPFEKRQKLRRLLEANKCLTP
jgi:hypothetical protein